MKSIAEVAIDSSLTEFTDRLEAYFSGEYMGTSSGFVDLDALVPGLNDGGLYIVGARPAMGKTAFALNVAGSVGIVDHQPVILFSLEMSQVELIQRMVAAEAHVDSNKLRTGDLTEKDWTKIVHAYARLCDAPIWIDDNPSNNVKQMATKARELKEAVGDLGLVVVDYLQLMTGDSKEGRQLEVSKISRELKILARELECPVMALSQLNRSLEARVDKRPMLSDLRESGSIEQDADVVMFLYRDEVYNPDTDAKGEAEVIVGKHRNGPTGMVRLAFHAEHTRFGDLSRAQA